MFDAWSQWRQEISQDGREMRLVDKIILVYKSEIHMMPEVDLNEVLHQFIAEVRKEGAACKCLENRARYHVREGCNGGK